MQQMFYKCTSLESVEFVSWIRGDGEKIVLGSTFEGCTRLVSVDLRGIPNDVPWDMQPDRADDVC